MARTTTIDLIRWIVPAFVGAATAVMLAPLIGAPTEDPEAITTVEAGHPSAHRSVPRERGRALEEGAAPRWPSVRPMRPASSSAGEEAGSAEPEEDAAWEDEDEPFEPELRTPEEEYASLLDGRALYAQRLQDERVDAGWASGAEDSMLRDLDRIAEALPSEGAGRFGIRDVECRSETCRARLSWSSASAAVELGEQVALGHYAEPCAILVLGPSPEALASNGAFEQEVFFDCG